MKIEARFTSKAPETTVGVDRFTILHGELELEIVPVGLGLQVRLNQPFGDALVVYPHASNGCLLAAGREPREFDHSKLNRKYFKNMVGYCVCEHCRKLPP